MWTLKEQLKEHLIYFISFRKRNCLTAKLYDGPRTLGHHVSEGCGRGTTARAAGVKLPLALSPF